MFGSTLGRVLRRTDIPVLVIPVMGGEEEWSETMVVHDAMGVCSGYATRRIAA
jgi:hypothetical protein